MSSVAAPVSRVSAQVSRQYSILAAFLSYLFPGLGQIYQGRVAKGVLFFVCLYSLYFYGMYLGSGTRVLPGPDGQKQTYRISSNVYLPDTADRPGLNPFGLQHTLANIYNRPQFAGQFWIGVAAWPAIWQYMDYDENAEDGGFPFGNFERTPRDDDLNAVTNGSDHLLDLGWVYTVIAGVLNIMVIYDAFAGPAFLGHPEGKKEGSA
jgi:TM2 domain-containing membrane protein YozV